jgi:hypothetical protein
LNANDVDFLMSKMTTQAELERFLERMEEEEASQR